MFRFKITSIVLLFYFLNFDLSFSKSPKDLINDSIKNYPGVCPCPYSIMKNGKKCGKKSAYSRPGGYEPLCYLSDINSDKRKKINRTFKITDGDTIKIGKIKYRLHGIDAPELNQICYENSKPYNCGLKATSFLRSKILDVKKLKCKKKDVDRYNRIIATCFYNNKNLNKMMVRSGWAIAYKKYSNLYVQDESHAKSKKIGLWKGDFLKPQEWRKLNP